MAIVQRENNMLSRSGTSIEEQLQYAYIQSEQTKGKKKKKNIDMIMLENIKKGGSIHKGDDDATLLANTYDPDVDPKNNKNNRQRQRRQEMSRDNPVFEDNEADIIPKKSRTQKKQLDVIDRDDPAYIVNENELVTKKKKARKKETSLTESIISEEKSNKNTSARTRTSSPSPDPIPSPTQSPKKSKTGKAKSRPKPEETEQERDEEVENEIAQVHSTNVTRDKSAEGKRPRKAKRTAKKANTQEEQHEAEAGTEPDEPSAAAEADHDRVVQITVHRTDKLQSDFHVQHPLVRIHVVDVETGACLKKQTQGRRVSSYFETENEKVDFILPIMTLPFDYKQHQSTIPVWEENIVFNENFDYVCHHKLNVMLFFEVMDFVSIRATNRQLLSNQQEGGWHHIAWAFLQLVGANGKPNIEKKVRLQLYQPPRRPVLPRNGEVQVFSWWKNSSNVRTPYPSTLYVTVKPIPLPKQVDPATRSMFAVQQEMMPDDYDELQLGASLSRTLMSPSQHRHVKEPSPWSRLPGQRCRIPNSVSLNLGAGQKGCFVLQFSHNGKSLACGCHDKDSYPIYIFEIPSGRLKSELSGHYSIIYDLCWSKSDRGLLSASADGTARIWNVDKMTGSSCKQLPHPSFVYAARYHTHNSRIVVTGGFDKLIRVWDLQSDNINGRLLQELDGHGGYINALCFDDDGSVLYSGDSCGGLRVWNFSVSDDEDASSSEIKAPCTFQKEITHKDISGNIINVLQPHPSGRRLLVHTRNNMIHLLDLRVDSVMCKYVGALNFREHVRSTLSPCGTFVFAGSEDGQGYVWNVESGDLVHTYSNLGFRNTVTDVAYHPFDHMVAFCSHGENHLIKVYSFDQKAVKKDLMLDTDELTGKGSKTSPLSGISALLSTDAPLPEASCRLTGNDLNMMQSVRLQRVMTKLRSVSALHSARDDGANAAMMTQSGSGWLPGMVSDPSGLTSFTGRQPQMNLTRTLGKSQLTVQDTTRGRDKTLELVLALYDYQAGRSDELSLKRGDRIKVLFKDNNNWWMGELPDGQQGYFPANYVTEPEGKLDRESDVDTDSEQHTRVHAVRTKTGDLKFVSAAEESDHDLPPSGRKPRPRKSRTESTA